MPDNPKKKKRLEIEGDCRTCIFAETHEGEVYCVARTKRPARETGNIDPRSSFIVGARVEIPCPECGTRKAWGEIDWRDLNDLQCPLPDAE